MGLRPDLEGQRALEDSIFRTTSLLSFSFHIPGVSFNTRLSLAQAAES